MGEILCNSCKKYKDLKDFYKLRNGDPCRECKKCFNFKRSIRFLDYVQGIKSKLRSPKEEEIAERYLRKKRIKKTLRGK